MKRLNDEVSAILTEMQDSKENLDTIKHALTYDILHSRRHREALARLEAGLKSENERLVMLSMQARSEFAEFIHRTFLPSADVEVITSVSLSDITVYKEN